MKNVPNCCFLFLLALLCFFCSACADIQPEVQSPPPPDPVFEVDNVQASTKFATPDEVKQFSHQSTYQADDAIIFPGPAHGNLGGSPLLHLSTIKKNQYTIGPGDVLSLSVWGRPDASSPK